VLDKDVVDILALPSSTQWLATTPGVTPWPYRSVYRASNGVHTASHYPSNELRNMRSSWQ